MTDARFQAVKLLGKTFGKGGYSNILVNELSADMDNREKQLCTAIYYGVLERKITLDYIISGYCRQKITKIRPDILNILRTGIYQLKFMDSIPDSAAVNESVDLAKKMRLGNLSGFVNGVLRNFIRDGKEIKYPDDPLERLAIEYSSPQWLIGMVYKNYGSDGLSLIETSLGAPPVTVRLNTAVYSREEILKELGPYKPAETFIEDCFEIKAGDITETNAYKLGMIHVQDISSQVCCNVLAPTENDTVFDLCAAPGGKTFTMAELMNGKGRIYSFDLNENRVGLIKSGAERLKLNNITAMTGNAAEFNSELPKADKILCDVPCSGLGVIRRKPEIKYKSPEEFKGLPEIQYSILENALRYLKKGGELVYSTCTVNPAENYEVAERFLKEHNEVQGVPLEEHSKLRGMPVFTDDFGRRIYYAATIFPGHFKGDGFFMAKFVKKTE